MENHALAVIDGEAIAVRRQPEEVLEEARKAAVALKAVIDAKPKKLMFNGEQYLEYEDWQTVGRFYGVTTKIVSTEFVEYGAEVKGFLARAVVLNHLGAEISAAEAMCLTDEEKWRVRADYEWRDDPKVVGKREKVKVGESPVPLFQLRSMAQTRAGAKAFRGVLSWVVVLAGYKSTPAEELPEAREVENGARPAQTSTDGTTATPAQTAQAATTTVPGQAFVKSLTQPVDAAPGGKNKPGRLTLEDGRSGTSFDKKIFELAEEAKAKHLPVVVVFAESDKVGANGKPYINVSSIDWWKPEEPKLPLTAEWKPDTEPVGGPEKVLAVRKVNMSDGSLYYVIQTYAREYKTLSLGAATIASKVGKVKESVMVLKFVPGGKVGGVACNHIENEGDIRPATEADVKAAADAAARKAEPAVEEPKDAEFEEVNA